MRISDWSSDVCSSDLGPDSVASWVPSNVISWTAQSPATRWLLTVIRASGNALSHAIAYRVADSRPPRRMSPGPTNTAFSAFNIGRAAMRDSMCDQVYILEVAD